MKTMLTFGLRRTLLICFFGLGGFIFSIALINTSKETLYFKSADSNAAFESSNSKIEANSFNCTANFVVEDQNLVDISNFQFSIPVDQFKSENKQLEFAIHTLSKGTNGNEIKFVQHRVMVLPMMRMIHLIGNINIANVDQPIALQLAYQLNARNELLIKGKHSFLLSEFGISIPLEMQGIIKNEFDLKLDLRMVENHKLIN